MLGRAGIQANPNPHLRVVPAMNQRGLRPMWKAPVLIASVLVRDVASSADARRRHHGYYGYGEGSSGNSTLDQWRARQQDQSGEPSRGDDRTQRRGRDRGDDRTQGRGQDPQSGGQDRSLDRGRDLG